MNDFLLLWLSLSFSGALTALALILLRPVLRQFSKKWQYYIWLLVILRLLIPFSLDINIVGGLFQQAQTNFTPQYTPAERFSESSDSDLSESPGFSVPENNNPQKLSESASDFSFLKNHIWGALWLSVATVLFFRKVYGYGRLVKTIGRESERITDGQLPAILQTVCTAMGVKKKIPVRANPLIRAPMLIGMLHPMIVLPARAILPAELPYVFQHELTHYRRKDFLYKWLAEIAVCLHWFNPFVYFVRKQIGQDCEFSCDEAVTSRLNHAERRIYGDTLLHSIHINGASGKGVVSLSLNEDGVLIRERLCGIMKYRRKSKLTVLIGSVLTFILFCGTAFAGAYPVRPVKNITASTVLNPVQVRNKNLKRGEKVLLGSRSLTANTACSVLLTWTGGGKLSVLCASPSNGETSRQIENGTPATFQIDKTDIYTIAVKNESGGIIKNITGTISFGQSIANRQSEATSVQPKDTAVQTVVYESVEMLRYDGVDGYPYIHDVKTNHTDKTIVAAERGMLAFDADGNPLVIHWNGLDSSSKPSYFFLFDWDSAEILPDQTDDTFGGWTLNMEGTDSAVDKIAYVLYCDKEITFEDGTIWKNPDFESWRSAYEGKKTDTALLKTYYPFRQIIDTGAKSQKSNADNTRQSDGEQSVSIPSIFRNNDTNAISEFVRGTEEGYQSLLALKTDGYLNQTVSDFNNAVLDWANQRQAEDYYADIVENDIAFYHFPAYLTTEEKNFLALTIRASNVENSVLLRSRFELPEIDPDLSFKMIREDNNADQPLWVSLMYGFSYRFDPDAVTVGERDAALAKIIGDVQIFWYDTSLDMLAEMSPDEVFARLNIIADNNSTETIRFSMLENYYMFQASPMF